METLKDIIVIYHAQCKDGFGAAYAAWKKFGDTATYLPMKNQTDLTVTLTGKTIYVLDYSFSEKIYEQLRTENTSVITIDHHACAEPIITKHEGSVYNADHSGAVLAWQYFHPETPVPPLLSYVEDHDLWRFALPHNKEFNAALREYEMNFAVWDDLIHKLTDPAFEAEFLATGTTIMQFEEKLVEHLLTYKERARFEGYDIYVLNVSRTYRSILGHKLATLNKTEGGTPLAIVYYRNQGAVHLSLRSEDDIDVNQLAQKYGGGGHKHAASIRVASFADLPFTFL